MAANGVRPEECLAQTDGELQVQGLDGPVRIVRDRWGIPHIDASSAHDAFFGQGYCMAQDRAWQIELYRQMAHGRAAALLNRGLLGRDRLNRRLGYGRYAALEWEAQRPRSRMILQAYADGINAAIETNPAPYEFRVLEHEMQPWHPIDSLAVVKMVNGGNHWASRLKHAKVAEALGVEAVAALLPDLPPDAMLITPSGARWTQETHPFAADIEAAMGAPDGVVAAGGGSNCWVIHGSRTASGAPIVCGDPHLAITLPAQWYVVHMQCPEFTAAGPCNPCYPGPLFYGHNTQVAWTMTHANGDRWDLYRERIRSGQDGPEAQYAGAWEPLTRLDERFEVRGEEPVVETVWETRHGRLVAGDPTRDDEVVAAAWGLDDPAHDFEALWAVLTSTNAAEAREGFRRYDSVSGNFCFADRSGDIGYQYAGRIPRRPAWLLPVPGWDGEHEWDGFVPKHELPAEDNPANGYIVTANNKTTTPDYPHYLSFGATRFRVERLHELLAQRELFTAEEMPALQGDTTSIHALELAARFTAFEAADADAAAMQALLRDWDGDLALDSAAAPVYARTAQELAARTARRYYEQVDGIAPLGAADEMRILHEQLTRNSALMLPAGETWDAAIEASLTAAARALREQLGDEPAAWRWGEMHRMGWRHNLGRDPELAPIFNLDDRPVPGDGNTVFNTQVAYGGTADQGVSFRQVLDLHDLNGARICIPPGNSGQPGSPHYSDNVERWAAVEYHPLYIEWGDIEANAEGTLRLTPG